MRRIQDLYHSNKLAITGDSVWVDNSIGPKYREIRKDDLLSARTMWDLEHYAIRSGTGGKDMKKLSISKLKIKDKAFFGHAGRAGKRGGSTARAGAARAVKPVSAMLPKYPTATTAQKIKVVAGLVGRSGAAGAARGVRTGVRIGTTIGGIAGSFIPGIGSLTGGIIGAAAGVQYGAMFGHAKGVADAMTSLGNRSKLLEVYKHSTNAALKAEVENTGREVLGTAFSFAKAYAFKFAAQKIYQFAAAAMFQAKTGRKWSDFQDFVKTKVKERDYANWQASQAMAREQMSRTPQLPGHVIHSTQTVNLKPSKSGGRTIWTKEMPTADILDEWPNDIVKLLDNFEARKAKLEKAGIETEELEGAFWDDMAGLVDVVDAGATDD